MPGLPSETEPTFTSGQLDAAVQRSDELLAADKELVETIKDGICDSNRADYELRRFRLSLLRDVPIVGKMILDSKTRDLARIKDEGIEQPRGDRVVNLANARTFGHFHTAELAELAKRDMAEQKGSE